ncbi:MAG: hypothetical protein ACR2QL_05925, partial [Woeseiaceae bacterium]
MRTISSVIVILFLAACSGKGDSISPDSDPVTITVLGTNDVHGEMIPADRSGGLTTFSGYVAAVRA